MCLGERLLRPRRLPRRNSSSVRLRIVMLAWCKVSTWPRKLPRPGGQTGIGFSRRARPVPGPAGTGRRCTSAVNHTSPRSAGMTWTASATIMITAWTMSAGPPRVSRGAISAPRSRARLPRVDFLRRRLHVRQQLQGGELCDLKSKKSRRTLPVEDLVINELSRHIRDFGSGALRYAFMARTLRRAARAAGSPRSSPSRTRLRMRGRRLRRRPRGGTHR
jgi:hypothetical protein